MLPEKGSFNPNCTRTGYLPQNALVLQTVTHIRKLKKGDEQWTLATTYRLSNLLYVAVFVLNACLQPNDMHFSVGNSTQKRHNRSNWSSQADLICHANKRAPPYRFLKDVSKASNQVAHINLMEAMQGLALVVNKIAFRWIFIHSYWLFSESVLKDQILDRRTQAIAVGF